ncbi:MAG: hypothetical protein M5U26_09320 [Planctomycetota bacterium]|nr:hypothetical protein [Planctomycetota bacterium]
MGTPILAGMPSFTVNEAASLRLEALSFFLMAFALCGLGVKLLWNYLQKDFPTLPRLTYLRACGLTLLLGLLFMIVLTMISGARELMTPGAWVKSGATYRLNSADPSEPNRERLWSLGMALEKYAAAHEGEFPAHEFVPELPPAAWRAADGTRFIYLSGRRLDDAAPGIVAYPSGSGDEPRPVLLSNLELVSLPLAEIRRRLQIEVAERHE